MQRVATRRIFHLLKVGRRLPGQHVRHYYVKNKKKKGPSGQAWLALAGITTTIGGVGIYLLGRSASWPARTMSWDCKARARVCV